LSTQMAGMGLLSAQPVDPLGINGSKLVMPGVPEGSTLLKRINALHTAYSMPPIAKNRIDEEAVARIAEWIKSMKPGLQSKIDLRTVRSADALDFAGSFRYAVNVGGQPITVGNVQFASDNSPGVAIQAQHHVESWGSPPNLGNSPADVALSSVFHSMRWSIDPEPITVTLSGLTPGRRYKLQVLFMERCCDRGIRISVNDVDVGDIATSIIQSAQVDGTAGSAFIYEFPSTTDTLTIKLAGRGRSDQNPILSGFTLEDLGNSSEFWDADGDGLLDDWELMYSGNRTSLGSGDADSDGQSDGAEFAAGTNPLAPQSFFSADLSFESTNFVLQWQSQLGTKYRVLRSDDLSTWVASSFNLSGTGGILTWPMPLDPQAERGFFRVQTVPPEAW
jgi:hypothetical protein